MYNLSDDNVNDNSSQNYATPTPDPDGNDYQQSYQAPDSNGYQQSYQTSDNGSYQQSYQTSDNGSYQQPYQTSDNGSYQQSYQTSDNGSYQQPYQASDNGNYQQSYQTQNMYGQQYYNGQNYSGGMNNGSYQASANGQNPYDQGKKPTPVFAILGIIFAVAAFPIGWLIPILGILLGIAGLVFGIVGLTSRSSIKGLGIASTIIAPIATIAVIVLIVYRAFTLVSDVTNDLLSNPDSFDNDFNFDFDFDNDYDFDFDDDDYDDEYDDGFYGYEDRDVDIDDVVLFSEADVTVTATSITYENYGDTVYPYVNVEIENNSTSDVTIGVDYCAVNNLAMSGSYFEDSVNAGKKSKSKLSIDSSVFSKCKFTDIGSIELQVNIYDKNTYEDIVEVSDLYKVTLDESYTPFTASSLGDANLIVSEAGVDFYYLGITTSYYDDSPCFLFYAENHSGQKAWVETDGFSINDYMQGDYDIDTVNDGNGALLLVEWDSDVNVDSLEKADVKFEITYYDSYDVFYTDEVVFYSLQ